MRFTFLCLSQVELCISAFLKVSLSVVERLPTDVLFLEQLFVAALALEERLEKVLFIENSASMEGMLLLKVIPPSVLNEASISTSDSHCVPSLNV